MIYRLARSSYIIIINISFVCFQEKEKQKLQRAKKAEHRLKKKAVKQHEDFKAAVKILSQHRMGAKNGRHLLKRHYVALIEDAGGVKGPGR